MSKKIKTGVSPTRVEDYPKWYQQVIKAAELAENSPTRGCMIIRPWGYGIWENIQRELDRRIKDTGHENAYFPLFIPLSLLEKEAAHVDGFAKECAVVTHHRLEEKDGKLVPTGKLDDPFVVRPTSETIIGEAYSKWVQSYRDLPLLINQWANVVRWEMRPRLFLRTAEFLWQEGHTVHATQDEAIEEVEKMLGVYAEFIENVLAIPVIRGHKSEGERFPGAVDTLCVEAMMQDGKALQAGTSHFLGQNFAKAADIKFLNEEGETVLAYTTSWGVSSRLIGGVIMVHSDDDGLRLPPVVAPKHVVILPMLKGDDSDNSVLEYCDKVAAACKGERFGKNNTEVVAHVDKRDLRGGEKNWQWIKKGIPLRIEIGKREVASGELSIARRDRGHRDKTPLQFKDLSVKVPQLLENMQAGYLQAAKDFQAENTREDITDFDAFKQFFETTSEKSPQVTGGFVKGKWCGSKESEDLLNELKITVRCIPLEQSGTTGNCLVTGEPATQDAIFARAY